MNKRKLFIISFLFFFLNPVEVNASCNFKTGEYIDKINNPKEIKVVTLKTKSSEISLVDLLSREDFGKNKLCKSKSEARRMISQGAVKIDGNKILNDATYEGLFRAV